MKYKSTNQRLSKFLGLSLMFLMLLFSTAYAQQSTLQGHILDDQNNPIQGASVQVKGKQASAQTDATGKFEIAAQTGDVLQISYVGFESREYTVASTANIRIQLTSDEQNLDEVVVIGYGTSRKKDLTGAVGSIKGTEIQQIPVTTAAQAITGKIAGVNVVTQSGAPGAGVNILVRGGTSITGSTSPLYVVDGFVMDDALTKIDIQDIENIDILKDASATAIYGARGANGVVLISTKSGAAGRTSLDYNGYASFEGLSKKLDLLSVEDYVKYQYEFQTLGGINAPTHRCMVATLQPRILHRQHINAFTVTMQTVLASTGRMRSLAVKPYCRTTTSICLAEMRKPSLWFLTIILGRTVFLQNLASNGIA